MTIALDFNKPATTDNYSTAFVPNLQANMQALATWLDSALVSAANQPAGTKRFNSTSGLFESWSGTAWVAQSVGYAKTGGDTFTGTLTIANNIALQWKDAGGTPRRLGLVAGGNTMYYGDIDNALTGANLKLFANGTGTVQLYVGANSIFEANSGNLTGYKTLTIAPGVGENLRMVNDGAFLSAYNTANTARTGYVSFNAGVGVNIGAENGAVIAFAVGGSERARFDTAGNFGFRGTPSAWGVLTAIEGTGGALAFNSTVSAYLVQNMYYNGSGWVYKAAGAASLYIMNSGQHQFCSIASGAAGAAATIVSNMTLDNSGNLTLTGNATVAGGQITAGTVPVIGTDVSNTYLRGVNLYLQNQNATKNFALFAASGIASFYGGAVTPTNPIGNTGGAVTVDCSKSNTHSLTLTSNMTGLTLSNMTDGQTVNIQITQDATGSRTMAGVTSANNYIWFGGTAGVLSTPAGSVDLLVITKIGTKMIVSLGKAAA